MVGERVSFRRRVGGVAGLGSLLVGCYTLQPMRGAEPVVGTKVAFDVNDAGRAALGGSMGPEIMQVEGHLIQRDTEGYLLAVSGVRLLRGGEQVWSGEQIRLNSQYVGSSYERRFSFGRSVALGVVGIGGFTALLATRSLLGLGTDPDGEPVDTGQARRVRP